MAPLNRVLWQNDFGVRGELREVPFPTLDDLGDRKVLIKVEAWAVTVLDHSQLLVPTSNYPKILGQDIAGTVESVVPGSTAASKFNIGDRVFGFTGGNDGFQDYVPVDYTLIASIPRNDIPYSKAVASGYHIATTSSLLFGRDNLHLDFPKLGVPKTGKTVLICEGFTEASNDAIQMATGAGYEVITTCYPHRHAYVSLLGAVKSFTYDSPTVAQDLVAELDKGTCAGIFVALGADVDAACQVSAASRQQVCRTLT